MCIYKIYGHIFLFIPNFIPIFVLPNKWIDYDFEPYLYIELQEP